MRGECIKFISLSFSLVSFQKLYFELFIARIMRFDSCKSLLAIEKNTELREKSYREKS